ncbi:MAG: PBP1A family penicillin-binding protein [Vampirovibrionales bacterium]|nr:PBP1A family penicillin-binding protein [Vampirovibrionales bacterium]
MQALRFFFFLLKKSSGLILVGCLLLVVAMGYVYKVTRNLPSIEKMVREGVNPSKYTQIFAADGSTIMSHGKFHHANVPVKDVSPHFIDALLATEDRRFYSHHGIDPFSITRAVYQNIVHRSVREGGSTLTQQLARNVFLSNERSIDRKIREAALAWRLENQLSKDEILELYINNIYFGEGAYGIAAASEIYFNKKPSKLSVEEAALLAGLPQAPSAYDPFNNLEASKKRRNEVLGNLKEVGKLNEAQLADAREKGVSLNQAGRGLAASDKAPFFNRYVIEQIRSHLDLDEQSFWQSGLKVYTTLDTRAQRLAQQAVVEQSAAWGRNGLKQQGALISLDPSSGAILAYVGGKNYQQSQFDRVSKAIRSPGSLFKVFTYTTAIDQGYDPREVYVDEPIEVDGWKPTNYDKKHRGEMTLSQALALSNNVIAVKLIQEVGPNAVVDMARRMGIQSTLNPFYSLTLGGSSVNLLEITSAYGVLANQGVRAEPYAIERVLDIDNVEIFRHSPVKSDVLTRSTVDTIVQMMIGVVQRGTGAAANIGKPMAGKTGTSDDYRDAWFIGFTPTVVTGVWVGNDDNTPMRGMTGGALPARIWKQFMQSFTSGRLASEFDVSYSKPVDYEVNPEMMGEEVSEDGEIPEGALEGEPLLQQDPSLYPDANGASQSGPNPTGGPLIPDGQRRHSGAVTSGGNESQQQKQADYNPPALPVAPLSPRPRPAPIAPPEPVRIPDSER